MTDIYEYKKVNVSLEPKPHVEAASNRWAAMGWRTVAVMTGDRKAGYADAILIERPKTHAYFEEEIKQSQAMQIAADLREEFPASDIPTYIEREFGKKHSE